MSEPLRAMSEQSPAQPDAAGPQVDGRVVDGGGAASDRIVSSEALFAGRAQIAIRHNQAVYFLRRTRFGKLILTK